MATTANKGPTAPGGPNSDPFVSNSQDQHRQRYAAFDSSSFSLYTNGSPSQARRALEAHLAETERRLQETSQLGTVLVQQRKELGDRLKEVEQQANDNEIGPELRKKLVELERECNEISKDTARAFIPKTRVPSGEAADGSSGATIFSNDATPSPSKLSAPSSRKQRNQQAGRIHDLKLATEISTSLLQQLRELQAVLAEKDDSLRTIDVEKSKLEIEVEGLTQRLRAMDESEQRYKDENWSLETQVHDFITASKTAADREQKLLSSLNATKTEKSSLERELEELKQAHSKLNDEQHSSKKYHETELSGFRRNISVGESERSALQRKVDELTNQNEELARAVSYRLKADDHAATRENASESEDAEADNATPDHSPPPSPSKATPRHGQLESETLKSSLAHAHRMIQQLKNNIHREKTEKMELKRLLHEARDDLDQRNAAGGSASKRRKGKELDVFKKPARPDRLGAQRSSTEDISMEEPDWEDHNGEDSPSKRRTIVGAYPASSTDTGTDAFDTAPENSDAFETANEREGTATETDAFHTGAENLDGDSSDLTETETSVATIRRRPGAPTATSAKRNSFMSTASTSADETDDYEVRTPVQNTQPKYRLKMNRSSRRSTPMRSSEAVTTPDSFKDSPASFISNSSESGAPAGQSLFAELGDLSAEESDEDDILDPTGTPSRSTILAATSPEAIMRRSVIDTRNQAVRVPMVDSEMMTEPYQPESTGTESTGIISGATSAVGAAIAGGVGFALGRKSEDDAEKTSRPSTAHQDEAPRLVEEIAVPALPTIPLAISTVQAVSSEPIEPTIPVSAPIPMPALSTSPLRSVACDPIEPAPLRAVPLGISSVATSQHTEPAQARGAPLSMSTLGSSQQTAPTEPVRKSLAVSAIHSGQHTEPSQVSRALAVAPVQTFQEIEPQEPQLPPVHVTVTEPIIASEVPQSVPVERPLTLSDVSTQEIEPVEPAQPIVAEPKSAGGLLGSVLGWRKSEPEIVVAEDETSQAAQGDSVRDIPVEQGRGREPFRSMDTNTVNNERMTNEPKTPRMATFDEETQTSLSATEIEKLLKSKHTPAPVFIPVPHGNTVTTQVRSNSSSPRRAAVPASPVHDPNRQPARRPGSAGSLRSRAGTPPPLPPDHKEVIAAAQRTSTVSGPMGPPSMPASAYKKDTLRPRTPNITAAPIGAASPGSRSSITPRARAATMRSDTSGPSRRSSVSSFASEIDQRFNIPRSNITEALDPNVTDPRMIQAITQTMIGEYLWKYTRKAGRGEMSEKRHRRFFWVHPYTRTLYWSEQDPSTAGRAQLKAKSVAIEAVQVVTDDNPMPPGLHRKSIIVVTPGRSVKFTATTGQRHETWFNALSYLLLRTSTERDDDENLTAEDVDEFNPGYPRSTSRQTGRSRMSLSSQHTAATRGVSPYRTQHPTLASRASVGSPRPPSSQSSTPQQPHNSVSSRLSGISGMFRPGSNLRDSFGGRRSRSSVRESSLYDATTVHDSAEDLRQVIEQQERDADRLENVRACCDGKHDVGSLSHRSRQPSSTSRHTSFGSMTRSMRGRSTQPSPQLHNHAEVSESSSDAHHHH